MNSLIIFGRIKWRMERFFGGTGGSSLSQWSSCMDAHQRFPFHPKERYTPSEQAGAAKVQWTDTMKYEEFPNTQEYAPTGYIPQALAYCSWPRD